MSRRILVVLAALALIVAACGGDGGSDDEEATNADADGSEATPEAGPEPEPEESEPQESEPEESDGAAASAGDGTAPAVGEHWHSAYGLYVCNQFGPPFPDTNDPAGIHSHADGIIHIHPFEDAAAGANATMGAFGEAVGIVFEDDRIATVDGSGSLTVGVDECTPGTGAELTIARWDVNDLAAGPEIIETGLADVRFESDLEAFTIGFVDVGTELPPPPSILSLSEITDTDEIPTLPDLSEFFPTVAVVDPPPEGEAVSGETPCPAEDGSAARTTFFTEAPPLCIEPEARYTAIFDTSEGVVTVELDAATLPETVNNFIVLTRYGYYDGTAIFRTDPSIEIIQGGSPHTNSPSDPGPGYTIRDEGDGFTYEPGQLVMARSAGPDSASAQFFFVTGERASALDAQGTYVVFGDVVDGFDVLETIIELHVDDPESGLGGGPSRAVVINSITIEQS